MNKVYIDKSILKNMRNEIDKVKDKNIETGGIILGKNNKEDNIYITHILDGGYKAERNRFSFKRDINYSERIAKKIYKKYGFYYIGDWHTHPNNYLRYSLIDLETIIATSKMNQEYRMIFIIAGNNHDLPFKIYSYNIEYEKIEELSYEIIDDIEKII